MGERGGGWCLDLLILRLSGERAGAGPSARPAAATTTGETATVTVKPARGIDLGAGPGNPVAHEVTGGSVGLILDARGRPIALPESRDEARDVVEGWYRELNIIDEGDA